VIEMHADRLLPLDEGALKIARRLYNQVVDLPILSPHGHTDPQWFADDEPFPDPAQLLLIPDHYVLRMLYSQGIDLARLGIPPDDGGEFEQDSRAIWKLFAEHYHLFRGTPSRLWMDYVFSVVFDLKETLTADSADRVYDAISECLGREAFKPRALFDRFNIELLATTESPLDTLVHHQRIRASEWQGRVISAFRPDNVVDPEFENFAANIDELAALTKQACRTYAGYLAALRDRRDFFRSLGATSTDHGHPSARTADLDAGDCERLYAKALGGDISAAEAEQFRGQMLTEMAAMSLEDGLVMQLHPGSWRNHNPTLYERFGRDKGADIPTSTDYVANLKPLLDRFGNEAGLTLILFTLDETVYSRELAPLAGHYPCLKLGPPWWFHDSPNGMQRFREMTVETAGFYNTVGFNDDTRAFLSIPARHDVARRMDCAYLARLVATHQMTEDEAGELAVDLAYGLAKQAYKL
jgi:glucuronate isomerase